MCEQLSQCYGSLNTEASKKLKELYEARCKKYTFYSVEMLDCYSTILKDTDYVGECGTMNDEDLTVMKRKAFELAKPCIFKLANESCTQKAANYLRSNFDEFVDFLTPRSTNETCESVSVELKRSECWHLKTSQSRLWHRVYKWYDGLHDIPDTSFSMQICEKVKACSEDPCNIISFDQQLQNCEIIEKLGTPFYSCLRDGGKIYPVSVKGCEKNDKECIRKTMSKECKVNGSDFDENYEWFNKYDMRKLNRIEIVEFTKNQTELGDPQQNGVVSDSFVGNCAPLVDELVTFMSRDTSIQFFKNTRLANETCSKVMECYKSIPSEKSRKLQVSLQQMCDIVEITEIMLYTSLVYFYEKELEMGHNIENSDYFSRNLTLKREAFLSTRTNVTAHAEVEWHARGKRFVRLHYEKFVDWITTVPETNPCKSVYGITENVQCVQNDYMVDIVKLDELTGEEAVDVLEKCRLFNKCMEGALCPNEETNRTLSFCESAKQKGIYFFVCLEQLHLEEPDYACSNITIRAETTAEHLLRQFKSDRECLKSMMVQKCGTDAVRGFNEYFDNVLNRD